ncbi:MAG: chorismate-binding protein, partial [Quisquiliibacterium sp.]
MTEIEFKAIAAQGFNRIPLLVECFADLETPLSLYLKLAHKPFSFLLESVVGGERFGRYSFIGLPASTLLRSTATGAEVVRNGSVIETFTGNPLDFVDEYRKRFKVAVRAGLPRFCGGLAGYFAYDVVRYIEPKLAGVSKPDPVGVPDILLLLTEELAIIDNIAGKIYLMVYADPGEPEAYQKASSRLRDLQMRLRQPVDVPSASGSYDTPTERDFPKDQYLAAVLKAKDYIMAGDMMQVQVGQVLRKQFRDSPLTLYRALRSINPSPYMYLYNFGDFHVVGASPEILVRQERHPDGDRVTIRPLAGTRKRGGTPEQDDAIAQELLADPK